MHFNHTRIHREAAGAFAAVTLDNGILRVVTIPERGGKICSIWRHASGREFLLQPREPERWLRRPGYGDSFEDYDTGGFDECMPTIAACRYPEEPFRGHVLPDHGELWPVPWDCRAESDAIIVSAAGRSLPYRLSRSLTLEGNALLLEYEASNLSDSPLRFLWVAHALLSVEPGSQIFLPREIRELEVSWSKDERLGKAGERCCWPIAKERTGQVTALNLVALPTSNTADKLFTSRLSWGFCALFHPKTNESISFHFDPALLPYIGLWICQGGWPTGRPAKHFTVGLEPCNGRPDSLAEAIRRDECGLLAARETKRWWLRVEIASGTSSS